MLYPYLIEAERNGLLHRYSFFPPHHKKTPESPVFFYEYVFFCFGVT